MYTLNQLIMMGMLLSLSITFFAKGIIEYQISILKLNVKCPTLICLPVVNIVILLSAIIVTWYGPAKIQYKTVNKDYTCELLSNNLLGYLYFKDIDTRVNLDTQSVKGILKLPKSKLEQITQMAYEELLKTKDKNAKYLIYVNNIGDIRIRTFVLRERKKIF